MQEYKLELKQGETTFRTGEALKLFQYQGYAYRAYTTDSFCRLLQAEAKPDRAVVFEMKKGFHAIVDRHLEDRSQDRIVYDFALSSQAKEWEPVFSENGMVFSIKGMINFLKRREPGEIEDAEIFMYAAQNFKYAIKTEADFTRDNDQNYVVSIKVGEAEGTIRVPECIYVNLPLLEGSDFIQSLEIEVEIHRPKDEKDGTPGFRLSCPKYERYFEKARNSEIAEMEHRLEGFLIVQGEPKG
jgi:hypothetical protein